MTKVYHSSGKDDWGTPQPLFDYFNERYNFILDAAASPHNKKCEAAICLEDGRDALKTNWLDIATMKGIVPPNSYFNVWCNPPYSKCHEFIQHAAVLTGLATVREQFIVMLVPARTDTLWWHGIIMKCAWMVELLQGRLCFEGAKAGAPFPSAILIFKAGWCNPPAVIRSLSLSPEVRGFKKKPKLKHRRLFGEEHAS